MTDENKISSDNVTGKTGSADRVRERAHQAAGTVREKTHDTAEAVREKAQEARDYTSQRYRHAKDASRENYDKARDYSRQKWGETREGAHRARARLGDRVERNPLVAAGLGVLGGLTLGLLLPRTQRENRAMGKYRDGLYDQATAAARAAKDASGEEFRGIADQAKNQAKDLGQQALGAAKKGGEAGLKESGLKSST